MEASHKNPVTLNAYVHSCLYTLQYPEGFNIIQSLLQGSLLQCFHIGVLPRQALDWGSNDYALPEVGNDEDLCNHGAQYNRVLQVGDPRIVDVGGQAAAAPGCVPSGSEGGDRLGAADGLWDTQAADEAKKPCSFDDYIPEENWDEDEDDLSDFHNSVPRPATSKKCSYLCRKSQYCPNNAASQVLPVADTSIQSGWPDGAGYQDAPEKSATDDDEYVFIPQKNGRKLFVKNISYKVKQHQLWNFFKTFGKVEYCEVLMDHHRRRSKGLGRVLFEDKSVADKVLNADPSDLVLDDRQMYVSLATVKKKVFKDSDTQQNSALEPEEDDTSISERVMPNGLYDDALLLIFDLLTIRERIRVQRVCWRWKNLSRLSLQKVRRLNVGNVLPYYSTDDRLFISLLKSGLTNLTSLDLKGKARQLTDVSLQRLAQTFPNLVQLDMGGMKCTNRGLHTLAHKCPLLQIVDLENCHDVGEDGLWWLFHKCKDLSSVNLTGIFRLQGQCFHVMCWNIKKLVLNKCMKLKDVALKKLVLRCKALEHLEIKECPQLTPEGLKEMLEAESMKTLKILHLPACDSWEVLCSLGQLPNLEVLQFDNFSPINNSVLMSLANGCPRLTVLNLPGRTNAVGDTEMRTLARCPCLKELNISFQEQVTDAGLVAIATHGLLTDLKVAYCTQLSDAAMLTLISSCRDLVLLDIRGCYLITNVTLTALLEADRQRHDSKQQFTLHLLGSSMVPNDMIIRPGFFIDSDNVPMDNIYDAYFSSEEEDSDDVWQPPSDDDDFLDNDDPLAEEEWEFS